MQEKTSTLFIYKKATILILLFCGVIKGIAQQDTIYYNTNEYKTAYKVEKVNAKFYCPLPLIKVGDLYKVKNYYMNGNLKMEGYYTDTKNEIFQGKTKWYYNNGQVSQIKNYKDGRPNGEALAYTKTGDLRAKMVYENGFRINGSTLDEYGKMNIVNEYLNGILIAKKYYYKDVNQVAYRIKYCEENQGTLPYHDETDVNYVGNAINNYREKEGYTKQDSVMFYNKNNKIIAKLAGNKNHKRIGRATFIQDYKLKTGALAYFHKNSDDEIISLSHIISLKDDNKEGEELHFNEEEKIISKGINKDNKPWSGSFYNKKLNTLISLKEGKKHGEELHFNEKGEIISKGINKDNKPWSGSFYKSDSKTNILTSFKDGKRHGKNVIYDKDGNVKKLFTFENGKVVGKVITSGSFKNKKCTCQIKDDSPFEGEVCKDYTVDVFKNGELVKTSLYLKENPSKLQEISHFVNKKRVKKSQYVGDTIYELTYKNDVIFSGKHYHQKTGNITTYKEGKVEGAFFTNNKNYNFTVTGNKKANERDGVIIFKNLLNNTTTSCTYKKGKPIDGTIIIKDTIRSYKNGTIHGVETTFNSDRNKYVLYDSISRNYTNGKLDGKIQFFKDYKLLTQGIYKNNLPFTGTFYKKFDMTTYSSEEYKDGELLNYQYIHRDFKQKLYYKKNRLYKSEFSSVYELLLEGYFKDEKPFNGGFAEIEKEGEYFHPEIYTLTQYTNGKKNGEEKIIDIGQEDLRKRINYKKDEKLNETFFFDFNTFKGKDSLIGSYKKGKPFSGDFFPLHKNNKATESPNPYFFDVLHHYENGKKSGNQYYSQAGSEMYTILDSINYVKGKPFEGGMLEVYKEQTHQHIYKNGFLQKTNIHNSYMGKTPDAIVTYTDNGFKVISNENDEITEVIYTTKDKNEGIATLYLKDIKIGQFSFSEKGITNTQIIISDEESKTEIKSTEINKIDITLDKDLQKVKFNLQIDWEGTSIGNLINLPNFLMGELNSANTISSYLKDKKTLIATCTIKERKPIDGVITSIFKDGTYSYKKYKNGQQINHKKNLTEKQLVEELKLQ